MRSWGPSRVGPGFSPRWCLLPLLVFLLAPAGGDAYAPDLVVAAALLQLLWVSIRLWGSDGR